jgi:D-3-phosphoglycerate dehydrogenase / 2-oxoglutarate reductase
MPVVYSTHQLHPRAAERLKGKADLVVASALDAPTLANEGANADIVIVRANIPPDLFGNAKHLRAAIRHGAGLDMIPVETATKAGVLVANVPGVNARTVADYVMFAALALARRFREIDSDLRQKGWLNGRAHAESARELRGATMGIVGMGHLGKAIATMAQSGLGMKVIAHTRRNSGFPDGVVAVSLDSISRDSDVVVLACPLTDETRGLVGEKQFALMRRGAYLINVARGAVIVEEALIAALSSGHLGGAALDVFATQPLRREHPLFAFPNVLLTPHLAGITEESMERMGLGAVDETLRILSGELPVNLVNPEVVPAYRRRFPQS